MARLSCTVCRTGKRKCELPEGTVQPAGTVLTGAQRCTRCCKGNYKCVIGDDQREGWHRRREAAKEEHEAEQEHAKAWATTGDRPRRRSASPDRSRLSDVGLHDVDDGRLMKLAKVSALRADERTEDGPPAKASPAGVSPHSQPGAAQTPALPSGMFDSPDMQTFLRGSRLLQAPHSLLSLFCSKLPGFARRWSEEQVCRFQSIDFRRIPPRDLEDIDTDLAPYQLFFPTLRTYSTVAWTPAVKYRPGTDLLALTLIWLGWKARYQQETADDRQQDLLHAVTDTLAGEIRRVLREPNAVGDIDALQACMLLACYFPLAPARASPFPGEKLPPAMNAPLIAACVRGARQIGLEKVHRLDRLQLSWLVLTTCSDDDDLDLDAGLESDATVGEGDPSEAKTAWSTVSAAFLEARHDLAKLRKLTSARLVHRPAVLSEQDREAFVVNQGDALREILTTVKEDWQKQTDLVLGSLRVLSAPDFQQIKRLAEGISDWLEMDKLRLVSHACICVSSSLTVAFSSDSSTDMVSLFRGMLQYPSANDVYNCVGVERRGGVARQMQLCVDLLGLWGPYAPPGHAASILLTCAHQALEENAVVMTVWGNLSSEKRQHLSFLKLAALALLPRHPTAEERSKEVQARAVAGEIYPALGAVIEGFAQCLAGWSNLEFEQKTVSAPAPQAATGSVIATQGAELSALFQTSDFDAALDLFINSGHDWLAFVDPSVSSSM